MSATDQLPYLVAQVSHGPGMHGPLLLIAVAVAVVGGLVYFVKSRRRSNDDPASHQSHETSDRRPEA